MPTPWGWTTDRRGVEPAQAAWQASKAAERQYVQSLNSVTEQIKRILAHTGPKIDNTIAITRALESYAELIEPWAESTATAMLKRADVKSKRTFYAAAKRMGHNLDDLLSGDNAIADVFRQKIDENVLLIKSLPLDAAKRVENVVAKGFVNGSRADEILNDVLETGDISRNRAMLIARTEISKASTALTQGRAEGVGSEGYIWRTAGDGDVRPSHQAMEGRFVYWNDPPTLDGIRGHAGEYPNDRCYPEPVIAQKVHVVPANYAVTSYAKAA